MVIIVRTDEGQPRPKYIFIKCGTNIYFFTLQRFGPSTSPNFEYCTFVLLISVIFVKVLFYLINLYNKVLRSVIFVFVRMCMRMCMRTGVCIYVRCSWPNC